MIPPARYFTLLIAILALIAFLACSDDAAPGDCIDAARDAGVPDRVIEWMKDPVEEWGTIERIAIREALEKFGIGEFCADVEQKLALAESSAMNNALETAKSAASTLAPSPEPPAPAPAPTRRPASTPMPAPTAARAPMPTLVPTISPPAPNPTPLGRWPEVPEVVEVTFSGIAGEEDSRFIVRFDEPVIVVTGTQDDMVEKEDVIVEKEVVKEVEVPNESVVVEKEVVKTVEIPGETVVVEKEVVKEVEVVSYPNLSSNDSISSSGVLLDVGNLGGSDRHIPIQTETSPDKPSAELSFGPVESEFAVAYQILLVGDTTIVDAEGNPAVIDFSNVAFVAPEYVVFVNPDYKDDITDPKLVNCVASMEILGYSPIILDTVKNLRSDKLTDSERIEWRLLFDEEFHYGIDGMMRLPCRQLWSEAINSDNESKRNRDSHCIFYLSRGTGIHSDAIELVNRPYTSLDASDRMQLRLVLNSDADLSSECAMYYPQLFYGRWIPMSANQ